MKRFGRLILIICAASVLVGGGCSFTPVDSRPLNEIIGSYSLVEYRYYDGNSTIGYADNFDYFYFVLDSVSHATVVYKLHGVNSYRAFVTAYDCTYKRTSTELVQEVLIEFSMPLSCIEGDAVYMFTVSGSASLYCQRSKYSAPTVSGGSVSREIVYITMNRVSPDETLGFIEGEVGYKITDITNPYLP